MNAVNKTLLFVLLYFNMFQPRWFIFKLKFVLKHIKEIFTLSFHC